MAELVGRRDECEALDRLVADVLAGSSRVLVLRGEAGVGKSALLAYLSGRIASEAGGGVGSRVRRRRGVGDGAGLQRPASAVRAPAGPPRRAAAPATRRARDRVRAEHWSRARPVPGGTGHADAGGAGRRAAARWPASSTTHCGWTSASAQIIGFVARRLLAERVALVCAARTGIEDGVLAGLPALPIGGLSDSDARPLLLGNVHGPIDAAVTDQIIAESHGNPLALLELPRTWDAADLAGGFGLPGSQPVAGKIEHSYVQRLRLLPADTRLLVLTAAAEPLGDPVLLRRAAGALGIEMIGGGSRRGRRASPAAPVAWSSPTRWSGRPPTARPTPPTGTARTVPSPTPPTPRPTRTGGPGTVPAPPPGPMRRWRPNWSSRPAGPRPGPGSRPPPPS